jgi:hypothetical protein
LNSSAEAIAMPRVFCTSWIVCAALLAPIEEGQSFLVELAKVVELGANGDTFGIDGLVKDTAIILIRPKGETCVLRFPIRIGESIFIRTSDTDGRSALCEAKLVSIEYGSGARFTAHCSLQDTSSDPKCPAQTEDIPR